MQIETSLSHYDTQSIIARQDSGFLKAGVRLDPDMAPSDIMRAAGLDWQVTKERIYTQGQQIRGKYALTRDKDGTVFDIVGEGWQPTQNKAVFEFFNRVCRDGKMTMEAAGASANGRHVWAVARTNEAITVGHDDKISGLVALSSPHIHGKAVGLKQIGERFFCANQIALSGKGNFARYIHSGGDQYSADKAQDHIHGVRAGLMQFKAAADYLLSKRMDKNKLTEYIRRVFDMQEFEERVASEATEKAKARQENRVRKLLIEAETMPGAHSGRGTWWQGLNLITHNADHTALAGDAGRQLLSQFAGANAARKDKALKLALDMAKA